MKDPISGYREIEHTADWALHVWAPDLETLFCQAAIGMYALAETELAAAKRLARRVELQAPDHETLLVAFLNELLFFGENEGLGFDRFEISISHSSLTAALVGAEMVSRKKEIKAVTFHNLQVASTPGGFEVTIVFDV